MNELRPHIVDPVLGVLLVESADCYKLEGPIVITSLRGQLLHLTIEQSKSNPPIDDRQRRWAQWIRDIDEVFSDRIAASVFDYYIKYRVEFRDEYTDDEVNSLVPEIQEADQIWGLINLWFAWIVADPADSDYDLSIAFEAIWDTEHNVEVKIRDGDIVCVSPEGTCGVFDYFNPPPFPFEN
ncbi:MAG: hypothetical protein AAGB29_09205 [Planctomycetota bacterium]